MGKKRSTLGAACLVLAISALSLASSATAKLTGEFTKFQYCPYTNTEVKKCLVSVTEGGSVALGNKNVPIANAVTLQGGFGKPDKTTKISKFFGATNGVTLQKVKQTVPGGLAGIVPPANSPWLVKQMSKFFFENGLTGLTATLELAKPASEIEISETHLSREEGLALKLPVKMHLENPFLGSNCYVGSSSSPIIWNLTSGATSPPSPNTSISGDSGKIEFLHEAEILKLNGNKLVDNAWSAPSASGCGGILSFLVDPVINAVMGNKSAGHNTSILENTIELTTPGALEEDNELNP